MMKLKGNIREIWLWSLYFIYIGATDYSVYASYGYMNVTDGDFAGPVILFEMMSQ